MDYRLGLLAWAIGYRLDRVESRMVSRMVKEFVGTGTQSEESLMMKVSGLVASYFSPKSENNGISGKLNGSLLKDPEHSL